MELLIARRIAILRRRAQLYQSYAGRMLLGAGDEEEDSARDYAALAAANLQEAESLENPQEEET